MGNTPRLRFEGFSYAWEQRKLSQLMDFSNGFNGDKEVYGDGTNFISVMDILNNDYITYGCIRGKAQLDEIELERFKVEYGDVLFQRSSENVDDAGRSNVYVDTNPAAFGGFVIRGKKKSDYDVFFMKHLLDSGAVRSQIRVRAQGAQHINVSQEVLSDVEVNMPSSAEQVQIGEFLREIDRMISCFQRKYEVLTLSKRFYLQNMFPQNGEMTPRIRFAGFTDTWEHRKCGDVLVERNIQHPQSDEFPLVSFTVENGVTPKTERYEREQLVRGDKKAKKYKETRLNDIVYNPANLKFGAIARNKFGNAVFSPIYVTYEVRDTIALPAFIEMTVTRESFIQNALQYQQGTVYERMAVNTDDFSTLDIMIPSKEEQAEIGQYFDDLDRIIALHQRKVAVLKSLKQFMLQNLFPEEA